MRIRFEALLALVVAVVGCRDAANPQALGPSVVVANGGPVAAADGSYMLSGTFAGLADNDVILVFREQGGEYWLLEPISQIDDDTSTWVQLGISFKQSGNHRLHVCSATRSVAEELIAAQRGATPAMPEGCSRLKTLDVFTAGSPSPSEPSHPQVVSKEQTVSTAPHRRTGGDGAESDEKVRDQGKGVDTAAPPLVTDCDLLPPNDVVLIRFNRDLEVLGAKHNFGIFRDQVSRKIQWIEQSLTKFKTPAGESRPVMKLHVEVPGNASYNGWWAKPNDDWTSYEKGFVIVRVRPGTPGPQRFKVEVKSKKGDEKEIPSAFMVDLSGKNGDAIIRPNQGGFYDVLIPLARAAEDIDLAHISEFVLVFEHHRVAPNFAGDLLVHSIRLSPGRSDPRGADALLEELSRRAFRWFVDNRNPETGLVLDRAPHHRSRSQRRPTACSIASVGYYLSMLPHAVDQKLIDGAQAQREAEQTLAFVLEKIPHRHGILPHFVDVNTGQPLEGTENSLLDSSIFLNSCMCVSTEFGGNVEKLADQLIDRVDWTKYVIKHHSSGKSLLSMGFKDKLLGGMDVRSSEFLMPYTLAVGSRTHPIDPQLWYNTTVVYGSVGGQRILNHTHPLFTSYYGLGWHPLAGFKDADGVDLEENARLAALANREFCRSSRATTYSSALGGWWGISAGDSHEGYIAPGPVRGATTTVWPTAAVAAIRWIPDELKSDIASWRKSPAWEFSSTRYGLAPFNVDKQWSGSDLIGIDLGSFYINYANYRTDDRAVRGRWAKHPVAVTALKRLGVVE